MKYVEEELTLADFSERFLGNDDFETPTIFDLSDYEIEVLGKDTKTGKDVYKLIKSFIIKDSVGEYYTDGKLKGSGEHRIINKDMIEIPLRSHSDFDKIENPLNIVDIEVTDIENYYANGRLNHNTTSGGKATGFHSSVRIRLKSIGQIKIKTLSGEQVIGVKVRAQVIKNRVGPPFRIAEFDVFFNRGIDDSDNWLKILKDNDVVKRSNPGFKLIDHKGEERKFLDEEWLNLLEEDKELKDFLYDKICNFVIMKYKKNPIVGGLDAEIISTDEVIEEND